jgi:hypothetical protein
MNTILLLLLIAVAIYQRKILMNQQELTTALNDANAKIAKIAKEQGDRFDTLTAKIQELTDIINAGGEVKPEVMAALGEVQTGA